MSAMENSTGTSETDSATSAEKLSQSVEESPRASRRWNGVNKFVRATDGYYLIKEGDRVRLVRPRRRRHEETDESAGGHSIDAAECSEALQSEEKSANERIETDEAAENADRVSEGDANTESDAKSENMSSATVKSSDGRAQESENRSETGSLQASHNSDEKSSQSEKRSDSAGNEVSSMEQGDEEEEYDIELDEVDPVLVMTGKPLFEADMLILCERLRRRQLVTDLSLAQCFFKDEDLAQLCKAMKGNTILESLDLSQTRITTQGIPHLCRMLEENSTITSLDVRDNSITDEGLSMLWDAIKDHPSLVTVNGVKFKEIRYGGYRHNPLEVLDLSGRRLKYPEIYLLCRALASALYLKEINLSNNFIGTRSMRALTPILCGLRYVEKIHLAHNLLDVDSGALIARLIKKDSVVYFDGSWNRLCGVKQAELEGEEVAKDVDTTGVLEILRAVHVKTHSEWIDLSGNAVPAYILTQLEDLIKRNRALVHLYPDTFDEYLALRTPDLDLSEDIRAANDYSTMPLTIDWKFLAKESMDIVSCVTEEEKGSSQADEHVHFTFKHEQL